MTDYTDVLAPSPEDRGTCGTCGHPAAPHWFSAAHGDGGCEGQGERCDCLVYAPLVQVKLGAERQKKLDVLYALRQVACDEITLATLRYGAEVVRNDYPTAARIVLTDADGGGLWLESILDADGVDLEPTSEWASTVDDYSMWWTNLSEDTEATWMAFVDPAGQGYTLSVDALLAIDIE